MGLCGEINYFKNIDLLIKNMFEKIGYHSIKQVFNFIRKYATTVSFFWKHPGIGMKKALEFHKEFKETE